MCSPYISSPLAVATPRVFSPPGRSRIIEGMMSILKNVKPIFLRAAMRAAYTLGSLLSVVSQTPDAIAVLGTDQPPGGHAVYLPRNVVQGDIQRAVAAPKAALVRKVANPVQEELNIQRVPAHDVGLEHERHAFVTRIADLAQAVHALVGVDPDYRIIVVRGDPDRPHVGDS